jgi:hypothetical protein
MVRVTILIALIKSNKNSTTDYFKDYSIQGAIVTITGPFFCSTSVVLVVATCILRGPSWS